MKTTELYVEQVLIGALAIAIAVLPWLPELRSRLTSIDAPIGLAGGSLALGLAFWLGIPFDRLADSISDRLDRHSRLRFALKRAKGSALPKKNHLDKLDPDLYPEDRLRIAGLRDRDAVVNWIDYHRSRIRLARALALYGPALTLTLTLGLERALPVKAASVNDAWLGGIVAAYLLWALLVRCGPPLPRTDEPQLIDYARRWRFVDPDGQRVVKSDTSDLSVWASEWLTLIVPAGLLGVALLVAFSTKDASVRLAACAGTSMTVISTWAWWRISFTYRSYLCDLDRYATQKPPPSG